jgi:hypothetical protein
MSRGINSFEDVRDSIQAMESPTFDEDSRSNLAYVKGETVLPLESPIKSQSVANVGLLTFTRALLHQSLRTGKPIGCDILQIRKYFPNQTQTFWSN